MSLSLLEKPGAIFEGTRTKVINNEGVLPPQIIPVGGRLSNFVEETYYERSLRSKYHSQGVQTLFYESTPSQTQTPWEIRSPQDPQEIYSNVFLVRKASGGWCPVIDLKNLNAHIHTPHFRMFTTSSVLSSVRKGDYAFKTDLQDAYIHVPIHPSSRKYLRFTFENKVYQFQVLPFGLNTAPQVFTRLGHTVTGYLHRQGISVIPYLDDWLIHHPDRQVLTRHQAQLINMLDLVGFILNRKKSELDLTQDLQFLGIRLRLDLGKALLPESKAWEIVARARHLSSLRVLTYSQVSQLMGSLNWASGLIPMGCLYLRPLQRYFHSLGLTHRFTPPRRSDPLVLAKFSYLRNPNAHVPGGSHDFYGRLHAGVWRSHGGFQDFGYLDPHRPQAPYQLSGAQSGYLCPTALGSSASGPPGYDCHGQFDSSFIYQQARRDSLPGLATIDSRSFPLVRGSQHNSPARHIPGCLNMIADHLSRPNLPISTEWSLHPEIVQPIFRVWGTP